MNISEVSIEKEDEGNCRVCGAEHSPKAFSNKLGVARGLPGLAFFSGYFCDACLKATQFGFQFGFEVGCEEAKKKAEKEDKQA